MARLADALRVAATRRAPVARRVERAATAVLEVREPAPAERAGDLAALEIVAARNGYRGKGTVSVTQETALRHSAVWACLRLRANLESSLPVDAFRKVGTGPAALQIEVAKPPLLVEPAPGVSIREHLYSSRVDLDRYGNSVGVIRLWNTLGQPQVVELAPMSDVVARMKGSRVDHWRICGERFEREQVWHERQYTVGGWDIGLSPIAYAAWSIGGYLSAQEFALDWFVNGAAPSGTLKNTQLDELDDNVIESAKARFRLAVANRDVFVTGADWEWIPAAMDAASAGFLEQQNASVAEVCRYLDVPGDMIDAPTSGSSITYANITQRNLQQLITSTGPAIGRREDHWSRYALPAPRFVKLNTGAFLRLDPQTQTQLMLSELGAGMLTPTEYRALKDRPPLSAADLAELQTFGIIGGTTTPAAPAEQGIPA